MLPNREDAEKILLETRKKIEKDEIPMRLIDAMFTFDKKQLIFNFVADDIMKKVGITVKDLNPKQ